MLDVFLAACGHMHAAAVEMHAAEVLLVILNTLATWAHDWIDTQCALTCTQCPLSHLTAASESVP